MPKNWLGVIDEAAKRLGGEVIRGMGTLMKPKGGQMKQMTLKELLAEVAKLRLGNHRLRGKRGSAAEMLYEKDIVPQLADRLKRAMDAINDAIDSWNKGWDCHSDPEHSRVRKAVFRLADALNEISYPKKQDAPAMERCIFIPTKNCPKCGFFMTWWTKSNGWYCGKDFLFIPDRNVGPDPNTP